MKRSTPAKPKDADPFALCLMGDHGTRKTTFALQFPKPGVFDLDCNLDGPERFLRSHGVAVDYTYVQPLLDEKGQRLKDDREIADAMVEGMQELVEAPQVRTIIADSGTKMAEALVWWRLAKDGRELMEIDAWRPWRSLMLKLVHYGRTCGKTFVLLIHEQPVYGPVPPGKIQPAQKIGVTMAMPSKLAEQWGFTFTDVWRVVRERERGESVYRLHFVSDGEACLKNSLGLTESLPMDWAKVSPHLKGRI